MRITFTFTLLISLISCQNSEQTKIKVNPDQSELKLYKLGDSISQIAQQTLLFNVGNAMQEGGSDYAVEFCNLNAANIIDSMSQLNSVRISRISNKNRSPENAPSQLESEILKNLEANNQKDTVLVIDGKNTYYKSIRIGLSTCLKCHGPIESIETKTYTKITEKYPLDKAVNYSLNDFRGAWKIVLE